jgi:hypothetical protein
MLAPAMEMQRVVNLRAMKITPLRAAKVAVEVAPITTKKRMNLNVMMKKRWYEVDSKQEK